MSGRAASLLVLVLWLTATHGCAGSPRYVFLDRSGAPSLSRDSAPGQTPWTGGLPLVESLPDGAVRVPDRTEVRVRGFGTIAEVVVQQAITVPADAASLVVMWPRPFGAELQEVELRRGGEVVTIRPRRTPLADPEKRRRRHTVETEVARLEGVVPELAVWPLTELPLGDEVTLRLRWHQQIEAHGEERVLVLPSTLGPTVHGRPLYPEVASARIDFDVELVTAAPVVSHDAVPLLHGAEVDTFGLRTAGSLPGDAGEHALAYRLSTEGPHATLGVDPRDGSFVLLVSAGGRRASQHDVVLVHDDTLEGPAKGLAWGVERELLSRLGSRDGFDLVSTDERRLGHAAFGRPVRAAPETIAASRRTASLFGHYAAETAFLAGEPSRPRRVVMLTDDGRFRDPAVQATGMVRLREAGIEARADVLAVGVGSPDPMVVKHARAGHGEVIQVRDHRSVRAAVDAWAALHEAPRLEQVRVQWVRGTRTVAPDDPFALASGGSVAIHGRFEGPPPTSLELTGTMRGAPLRWRAQLVELDGPLLHERVNRADYERLVRSDTETPSSATRRRLRLAGRHAPALPTQHHYVRGAQLATAKAPVRAVPNGAFIPSPRPVGGGVVCVYPAWNLGGPYHRRYLDLERSLFDEGRDRVRARGRLEVQSSEVLDGPATGPRFAAFVRSQEQWLGGCLRDAKGSGEHELLRVVLRLETDATGKVTLATTPRGMMPLLDTEECLRGAAEALDPDPDLRDSVAELDMVLWSEDDAPPT